MQNTSIALDAMRTFEACGRLLSFTAAAHTLASSQPAVSQQIKRLEGQLGQRLFERTHRSIALTPAGRTLLAHVQEGLQSIDAGVLAVQSATQRAPLQVQTDFAFAAYWLLPRIGRFQQDHPDIALSLLTSNQAALEANTQADATIVFGSGRVKHAQADLLFQEEVFPVCSPHLLPTAAARRQFNPAAQPLLQLTTNPHHAWFDWQRLLAELGLTQPPQYAPINFDNYTLLVQAAIAGQGIAIGWRHLVDDLLDTGLLVRVGKASARSSLGYHLVIPQRKRQSVAVKTFARWLLAEMEGRP
jgi:putative choline sulfate-utilization transcription factor